MPGIYTKPTKEQEALYRTVKCPHCRAEPGEPCRPMKSYKSVKGTADKDNPYSHAVRRTLATSSMRKKNEA